MGFDKNDKLRHFLQRKMTACCKAVEKSGYDAKSIAELAEELESTGIGVPHFYSEEHKDPYHSNGGYIVKHENCPENYFLGMRFNKKALTSPHSHQELYLKFGWNEESCYSVNFSNYCAVVYKILERFEDIVQEYKAYEFELDKQEKILEITANSIDTWIHTICKEAGHPYTINKMETKLVASILLETKTQLDISIPYKKFQEIMPGLLDTIKIYEDMQKNCKAKILIKNPQVYHVQWIDPKEPENGKAKNGR